MLLDMSGQQRSRVDYATAQSDQDLYCLSQSLTELIDSDGTGLDEAVLASTHNLCFEQKYEKYLFFFFFFFFLVFGGEIFYIFE